eukprot:scaffold7557_cov91-Skeletonema_marinoi.AAC.1
MLSSLRPMLDCHIDSSWDLAAKMTSGVWIWNNFFSPVKILNNWFDVLSSLGVFMCMLPPRAAWRRH